MRDCVVDCPRWCFARRDKDRSAAHGQLLKYFMQCDRSISGALKGTKRGHPPPPTSPQSSWRLAACLCKLLIFLVTHIHTSNSFSVYQQQVSLPPSLPPPTFVGLSLSSFSSLLFKICSAVRGACTHPARDIPQLSHLLS